MPEHFGGLVIKGIGALAEHNPRQFPIMKATIEGFQAVNLLPNIVGNWASTVSPYDLDITREEPQHPLLAEAPMERADCLRMRGGCLGTLRSGPIGKEHQWANYLIAPLGLIHQPQLQLGKLCG
jgi:hypothetical protein